MTQTAIPAGLGETFGLVAEATVGTYVTPTRWIPHKKADMKLKKTTVQSQALQGSRFEQANRRVLVERSTTGAIDLEIADKQFGLLLAQGIGSTVAAVEEGSSGLYVQYHVPGYLEGNALSIQKGVPTIGGAIQAFSYAGNKIVDWTIAVQRGGLAMLTLTTDGWTEVTATSYTSATYLAGASAPNLLNWSSGSLLTGGTVSTSAGITTVASGATPVGLVSSFSVKGTNKLAVDRFTLGSMVKAEQLTDGFTTITGDLEIEFANLTDFYTAFAADTPLALQLNLTSPQTGSGGGTPFTNAGLYITIPSIRFDGDTPDAPGPGVIRVKVPFTGLLDSAGDPVIQLAYVSTDTTV